MKLQMDSTLNYGKHSHVVVTPERIKSDMSYHNTYKHKGLPPYPLGTVTLDALKAAMSPQKSDYLFFMLDPKGGHNFTATYDKHLENIRAFRVYQKEPLRCLESVSFAFLRCTGLKLLCIQNLFYLMHSIFIFKSKLDLNTS